ncbi:MAG: glycosyltransferase [Euryarchaeota archaeon]|nr:glycosyltransferase [Euryarchaeota archaeon]
MQKLPKVSVVIPVHNGEKVIGRCLDAVFRSSYPEFEVVVVDDCSTDRTREICRSYPVKLISFEEHAGVSKARNTGARNASGEVLLFIDADCIMLEDTIQRLIDTKLRTGAEIVGGTYTRLPEDSHSFFSTFQSVYVNYCESRNPENPDYAATHCMAVDRDVFLKLGGFIEGSYIGVAASVEDVEFCHRAKRAGYRVVMEPQAMVKHVFNFNLYRSLRNAVKKSMYWTMYSLDNRDITQDSGAASKELKLNVACYFSSALLLLAAVALPALLLAVPPVYALNLYANRGFFRALRETKGTGFMLKGIAYYTLLYPAAVGAGAAAGVLRYLRYVKFGSMRRIKAEAE